MNILDFKRMKQANEKISMVTCYDYWSASIIQQTDIDCVLVGDSAAMVMHGHETTIPATLDMMAYHTAAVKRGANDKFIIADVPFLAHRKGFNEAMDCVQVLMQAGADAIKLEGAAGNEALIEHLVTSGVPVMGHLGLTPQSVHQLGGFRVQGKEQQAADKLLDNARILEKAGCFAIVVECIPSPLAKTVTQQLSIATIGIGAGNDTDGQVLVLQDLLGLSGEFNPKFVRQFMPGGDLMKQALNSYHREVKCRDFPAQAESF